MSLTDRIWITCVMAAFLVAFLAFLYRSEVRR